jgi:twitching motility two-component system response regulator PilH
MKAEQIAATGAKVVVTSCHNCVDGLGDLIKHYKLDCEVKQLVDLVAEALVLEEVEMPEKPAEVPVEVAVPAVEPVVEPAAALAGRRILIVDDEPDVRVFLSTVLEDAGAEVLEATDGDEALAIMAREKPDIVTLDLSMPGKDGVETFGEMRRHPDVKEIPVCIVTGHPEFRTLIYDRPVPPPEGYMDKPVNEEDLVSNLRRILELRDKKA